MTDVRDAALGDFAMMRTGYSIRMTLAQSRDWVSDEFRGIILFIVPRRSLLRFDEFELYQRGNLLAPFDATPLARVADFEGQFFCSGSLEKAVEPAVAPKCEVPL